MAISQSIYPSYYPTDWTQSVHSSNLSFLFSPSKTQPVRITHWVKSRGLASSSNVENSSSRLLRVHKKGEG